MTDFSRTQKGPATDDLERATRRSQNEARDDSNTRHSMKVNAGVTAEDVERRAREGFTNK